MGRFQKFMTLTEAEKVRDWSKIEWEGTDKDIETSLFEYGFVATQDKTIKDIIEPDEWFVLYKTEHGDKYYDTGYFREKEFNSIIEGKEWASKKDIDSFLSFVGQTKEEWLELPFVQKLSGLLSYWGVENIMGTSYHPFDKKKAMEMIGETEPKKEPEEKSEKEPKEKPKEEPKKEE